MPNELEQFLGDIPSQDKPFIEPGKEIEGLAGSSSLDDKEDTPKQRKYRRLEEQLQRERESNIALNERVKVLAEMKQSVVSSPSDLPVEWVALFGDTPESQKAWKMQEQLLMKAVSQGKQEAISEFEQRQVKLQEEEKKNEQLIGSELESLEDEHNIDLTSNAPGAKKARREFLDLVQQLSPKDAQGNILHYADFGSTFDLYQKTQDKPDASRAKVIAAKTMQKSGSSSPEAPGPVNWRTARSMIDKLTGN